MREQRSAVRSIVRLAALASACVACAAAGARAEVVLDAQGTCWRWMNARRPIVQAVRDSDGGWQDFKGKKVEPAAAEAVDAPPPAGWTGPDFDDADWPRVAGRRLENLLFVRQSMDMGSDSLADFFRQALVCLRGKFHVADPAAVEGLRLTASYRGGIVVYLNGTEIARQDLPAGPLTPAAPATAYPPSAWLTADGKALPEPARAPADSDDARRIASRDRHLAPVPLPARLLRKGVNVLAVEIHRSDFDPAAGAYLRKYTRAAWNTLALTALCLEADAGIAGHTARPAGVQVWTQDRNDRTGAGDYGDPCEPVRPIVLTGARNGTFSGKVAVGSDQAITGLSAEVAPLQRVGGEGRIGGADLRVRFSPPVGDRAGPWPEPLSEAAPARVAAAGGGAVCAVWVSVRVPPQTAAGEYRGVLSVSAGGAKVADVPVHLHVADWTIPDPKDFRTFVGLYQLPLALSRKYDAPMWSDRHWQLMGRSFQMLGELGNRLVQIPVVDQTKLGNEDGMVFWIRKEDGSFDHDFRVVERYLDLLKRHMGVPKFVVVHLWHAGGWSEAGARQKNTVTVIDPATGAREHMQVPEFGTDASKAFWKPVLEGLGTRLADRGMEKSLVLGSLCEKYPEQAVNRMFAELLGEPKWLQITHASHGALDSPNRSLDGGGEVPIHIFTYLPGLPQADAIPPLHKPCWPRVAYFRRAQGTALSLLGHRLLPADTLYRRLPGFSHACLDYWLFPDISNHRGGLMYGRFPHAGNYPGDPEPACLVWPGKNGPEPLASYEALREGLQEAEALITLSAALANDPPLEPQLAQRCRQALVDYLTFCDTRNQMRYQYVYHHMNHYGWRDLSQRLFALAAEVMR